MQDVDDELPRAQGRVLAPEDLRFIAAVFGLSPARLGAALGVARCTIVRWMYGRTSPDGLHGQVLGALFDAARAVKDDHAARLALAAGLSEGIGQLVTRLLLTGATKQVARHNADHA